MDKTWSISAGFSLTFFLINLMMLSGPLCIVCNIICVCTYLYAGSATTLLVTIARKKLSELKNLHDQALKEYQAICERVPMSLPAVLRADKKLEKALKLMSAQSTVHTEALKDLRSLDQGDYCTAVGTKHRVAVKCRSVLPF